MIDATQPFTLSQEPPRGAEALVQAAGGAIETRANEGELRWVLCLPATCVVREHLRYRGVTQYHLHLSEACVLTLCVNRDATTGEEWSALVLPALAHSPSQTP